MSGTIMNSITEKYKCADAFIAIEGKEYALFKKSPLRKYPHMVDLSTGKIPDGDQRPLLGIYLLRNGVSKDDLGITTHDRVKQAIDIAKTCG